MIHNEQEYVCINGVSVEEAKLIIKGMKIPYRILKKPVPAGKLFNKQIFSIKKQIYIPKTHEEKFKNCIV
jgi:hypothetical protein